MEIKLKGIDIARIFEEALHKELPYLPVVVAEGDEFETLLTAVIFGKAYKVSYYQLLHEGIDANAKALAVLYKSDLQRDKPDIGIFGACAKMAEENK